MRLIVREYLTADGRSPWRACLDELDVSTRARVQARVRYALRGRAPG